MLFSAALADDFGGLAGAGLVAVVELETDEVGGAIGDSAPIELDAPDVNSGSLTPSAAAPASGAKYRGEIPNGDTEWRYLGEIPGGDTGGRHGIASGM